MSQRNTILEAPNPSAFLAEDMFPQRIQFKRTMCEWLWAAQVHYHVSRATDQAEPVESSPQITLLAQCLLREPTMYMWCSLVNLGGLFGMAMTPHFFLSALRCWDPNTIPWWWVKVFYLLISCGLVGHVLPNRMSPSGDLYVFTSLQNLHCFLMNWGSLCLSHPSLSTYLLPTLCPRLGSVIASLKRYPGTPTPICTLKPLQTSPPLTLSV